LQLTAPVGGRAWQRRGDRGRLALAIRRAPAPQLNALLDRHRSVYVRARRIVGLAAVLLAAWPGPAHANAGVPMVALYLPSAWLLLIPIIFLEATHGRLRWGVPFRRALVAQGLANAVSSLVGLPLCWVLLASVELLCCGTALGLQTPLQRVYAVTIQAPWLIPYEKEFWWMVPSAIVVLTVLFCAMSIGSEYPIVKRAVPSLAPRSLWHWVIAANVTSYSLLLLVALVLGRNEALASRINEAFSSVTGPLIDLVFRVVRALLGVK
jgi:hypothetical protein